MKQRIVMTGVEKEAKQLYEELKKCSITPLDDGKGGPKLVRVDGGESDPGNSLELFHALNNYIMCCTNYIYDFR